jgi:hypothetical protein
MILDSKPYSFDRVVRMAMSAGLLWALIAVLGYLSSSPLPWLCCWPTS